MKKKMTVSKFRGAMYATAKYLGDYQALTSKKPNAVQKRIWRRILGKIFGRWIGKIVK